MTDTATTIQVRLTRKAYDHLPDYWDERRGDYEADGEVAHLEVADAWANPDRQTKRFVWFTLSPEGARALYQEMDWEREQLSWEAQDGDLYPEYRSVLQALRRWCESHAHLEGDPTTWKKVAQA